MTSIPLSEAGRERRERIRELALNALHGRRRRRQVRRAILAALVVAAVAWQAWPVHDAPPAPPSCCTVVRDDASVLARYSRQAAPRPEWWIDGAAAQELWHRGGRAGSLVLAGDRVILVNGSVDAFGGGEQP